MSLNSYEPIASCFANDFLPEAYCMLTYDIGVGMILKLGGLNHGEHVRSGTLSIISHFKDYVHK